MDVICVCVCVCVCVEDYSRLGGDLSTKGGVAEIYACVKDFVVRNFGKPGISVLLHSSGDQGSSRSGQYWSGLSY